MQALILVGGEGTRLRPLTSTTPKPVVPLVDRPFIAYMLDWLGRHGVDDVILACGFMPDRMRRVLGDRYRDTKLTYIEEPSPLGTGGALKFAEDHLDERFLMLNGDVLTDIDLTAQLNAHERTGARATLALIPVDDPSAYGLVRLDHHQAVTEFVEKPAAEEIDTNLINAGAYILEREILATMPPKGTNVSIEREVFPRLVGDGLYALAAQPDAYWMDIGTPQRYLQGTFDILDGHVRTEIGSRVEAARYLLHEAATVEGHLAPPVYLAPGSHVASGAHVGGRAVIAAGASIGHGAHVENSVILERAQIGERCRVHGAIVGPGVTIGPDCRIGEGVMLGEGVTLGAGNVLQAGARIFPGVRLPDAAITF